MTDIPISTGWSRDGNWFWDGLQWNDAVSPDGKWRFDGRAWKTFKGKRTPMPAEPLHPPPMAPPPPESSIAMPSWVAGSEIERLDKERRDRAIHAATPRIPLPPELDWRRAGEHIKYSRPARDYSVWQVGYNSVVLFIVLYLACAPASFVFIWWTAWRVTTKVIVAILSLVTPFVVVFLAIGTGLVHRTA